MLDAIALVYVVTISSVASQNKSGHALNNKLLQKVLANRKPGKCDFEDEAELPLAFRAPSMVMVISLTIQ